MNVQKSSVVEQTWDQVLVDQVVDEELFCKMGSGIVIVTICTKKTLKRGKPTSILTSEPCIQRWTYIESVLQCQRLKLDLAHNCKQDFAPSEFLFQALE